MLQSVGSNVVCRQSLNGFHLKGCVALTFVGHDVDCNSLVGDPLVVLADPNGVSLCPSLGRPHLPRISGCTGLQRKRRNGLFL